MKKKLLKLLSWIAAFIVIAVVLNIQVSTRQGINYSVSTLEMPLYLKVLDFFDRHYNYKLVVERIIGEERGEKEKVLKIFEWTHNNIKRIPLGYPVIDDHVWHIIVRGYGVDDQSSDVFTTLCNYAGVDAFYNWVDTENHDRRIALSFVRFNGIWNVFDPYNGVYFKNNKGELAGIEEIVRGNWLIEKINASDSHDVEYTNYFKNLTSIKDYGLKRPNIQSPINRLKYEIKKRLR